MNLSEISTATDRERLASGQYKMRFDGFGDVFEAKSFDGEKTEQKFVARFVVTEGDCEGQEAPVFCKVPNGSPHPKSNLAKVIQWVTGAPLSGEVFRYEDFIGTTGTGMVGPNQNGTECLLMFKPDEVTEF